MTDSKPHSTLTDPRERIANMRRWNDVNVGDYWQREADFWESIVEQIEQLKQQGAQDEKVIVKRGAEIDRQLRRAESLEEQLETRERERDEETQAFLTRTTELKEQLETVDQALGRMEWQIKRVLPEDRIDTFLTTLLGDIVQLRAHVSSPASKRDA